MPVFDSIFQRSPLTPTQSDMDPSFTAVSSPSAPSLLFGAYTTEPSLWINIGVLGTITVNGETFSDNGWKILALITDFAATFTDNPLDGNFVYQQLEDPTRSAVLAKLALPSAGGGSYQKWSQTFLRLLSAA
jgi:hypothetical protein